MRHGCVMVGPFFADECPGVRVSGDDGSGSERGGGQRLPHRPASATCGSFRAKSSTPGFGLLHSLPPPAARSTPRRPGSVPVAHAPQPWPPPEPWQNDKGGAGWEWREAKHRAQSERLGPSRTPPAPPPPPRHRHFTLPRARLQPKLAAWGAALPRSARVCVGWPCDDTLIALPPSCSSPPQMPAPPAPPGRRRWWHGPENTATWRRRHQGPAPRRAARDTRGRRPARPAHHHPLHPQRPVGAQLGRHQLGRRQRQRGRQAAVVALRRRARRWRVVGLRVCARRLPLPRHRAADPAVGGGVAATRQAAPAGASAWQWQRHAHAGAGAHAAWCFTRRHGRL